jgi:alkylation response protein AidB-like acyl-CoA dehydrogenase
MLDSGAQRFAREPKICDIYRCTKEIQKNTIASALIDKPKQLRQWPRQ